MILKLTNGVYTNMDLGKVLPVRCEDCNDEGYYYVGGPGEEVVVKCTNEKHVNDFSGATDQLDR